MTMSGVNNSVTFRLEILTPTHSGCGTDYIKELDYIERDGEIYVVDQKQTLNAVARRDIPIDKFPTGNRLSEWVKAANHFFGYPLPWLGARRQVPERLKKQLKDAMNRPYLAGSSLKGAIRSALIAEWLRAMPPAAYEHLLPNGKYGKPPLKQWAAKPLMERITGNDPKNDIFRPLKVKDAIFADEDLGLADIRWLNESRWRSMSKKTSTERWPEADGVFLEVLRPQAWTLVNLQLDEFLFSGNGWRQKDAIASVLPDNFAGIREKLNHHAAYRLNREIEFYRGQNKPAPEQACQRILDMLQQESSAIYLQTSSGIGWRGMTGDWAAPEHEEKYRTLFRLGRTGRPFPKTRRLAVGDEPAFPMGWVRLLPSETSA